MVAVGHGKVVEWTVQLNTRSQGKSQYVESVGSFFVVSSV
jgi:hypothetical protein